MSLTQKNRIFHIFNCHVLTQKWKDAFFFHFRKIYGQTQPQNFEQKNRWKSGQMKHPYIQDNLIEII